jgi:hypothetical protein
VQTLSCNLTSKILLNVFAGFLGSHNAISLIDLVHKVVVTDDMFIGRDENISGPINWAKLRYDRFSKIKSLYNLILGLPKRKTYSIGDLDSVLVRVKRIIPQHSKMLCLRQSILQSENLFLYRC